MGGFYYQVSFEQSLYRYFTNIAPDLVAILFTISVENGIKGDKIYELKGTIANHVSLIELITNNSFYTKAILKKFGIFVIFKESGERFRWQLVCHLIGLKNVRLLVNQLYYEE